MIPAMNANNAVKAISVMSVAAAIVLTLVGMARAVSERTLIRPGQLLIDGLRVRCGSTPVLISRRHPDFGAARPGLIILNPVKLQNLPRGARLLVYYHECAHQHVGGSELAADCWAVQKVRREGLMDRAGLGQACSFIKGLPANRRHPPGNLRCNHMKRCYNDTFRNRADGGVPGGVKGDGPASQGPMVSSRGFSLPGISLDSLIGTAPKK